ncbi:MAG: RNase J family beta-CASP ribonuclease [Clostridia bacterium]|nr:RNase J family beta-CASP ribonuclease [Clostridia bacterium]
MPKKKTTDRAGQPAKKNNTSVSGKKAGKKAEAPETEKKQKGKRTGADNTAAQKTAKPAGRKSPALNKKTKKTDRKDSPRAAREKTAAKNKTGSKLKRERKTAKSVKIGFLGGLNEIGKNITVYEYDGDIMIVDCGLAFPEADMLGVDLVIPDFTYLIDNAEKIRGIVITHGHEDHIGSLAYFLQKVNVPIYATRLTVGLIEGKLAEHNILGSAELITIRPGDTFNLGKFGVEAIHVNHSIPDALAFAITCGAGTIVQMGDFKIDSTPIDGGMIDINRFGELGNQGVLCMLSDSTNAERPGFTESERKVGESLKPLFEGAGRRRIIIATFASNVHRVQQIINQAHEMGRKTALSGRSLENVVRIGTELGYLNIPEGSLVSIDMVNRYPDDKMVIVTTGSQGEPMSALSRMAFSDHKKVAVGPNDYVIISATPIPGNEKTVGNVINELLKLGADVVYEKAYGVHVSGHACQEELKLMMGIIKPRFFIPVHGEQKHLRKHAKLAESMGIPKSNIFIPDNGIQIEVSEKGIKRLEDIPAGQIFVDGSGVGDVGNVVLRDRKRLSEDGLVVVVAGVDSATGEIVGGPDILTRGFVYVKESEDLIYDARMTARYAIESSINEGAFGDWNTVKSRVRDEISHLMYEKTKRSPMILSIIMEV